MAVELKQRWQQVKISIIRKHDLFRINIMAKQVIFKNITTLIQFVPSV